MKTALEQYLERRVVLIPLRWDQVIIFLIINNREVRVMCPLILTYKTSKNALSRLRRRMSPNPSCQTMVMMRRSSSSLMRKMKMMKTSRMKTKKIIFKMMMQMKNFNNLIKFVYILPKCLKMF
jgi:hypothetical protein